MSKHKNFDTTTLKVDLIASMTNPSGNSCHARNIAKVLEPICDLNLPLFAPNELTDAMSNDDVTFIMSHTRGPRSADIVLHYTLPPRWEPASDSYNIGIISWETSKIPDKDINLNDGRAPVLNNWATQCNKMDEIWTFSTTAEGAMKNAGVTVPIHVYVGPIDTDFWSPDAPVPDRGVLGITHDHRGNPLDNKFVVGYMADWNERKDIDTFVSCCLVALPPADSVVLLKSHNYMSQENVRDMCRALKDRMVMYNLPPLVVVDEMMKEEDVRGLLQCMDVYVSTSRGEGLNLPALQAMSMEKPVIAGSHSAHVDYMDGKNAVLLPVNLEVARTMIKNPWYQNDQIWGKINEVALVQSLQELHKRWKSGEKRKLICADARSTVVKNHSYNAIRPRIKKRLQQIATRSRVGAPRRSEDPKDYREPKIPPLPTPRVRELEPSVPTDGTE